MAIRNFVKNEWVIYTQKEGWSDLVKVWVGQYQNGKFQNITIDKDGQLKGEAIEEGAETANLPCFMKVPGFFWREFVKAINDEMPNLNEETVDAELRATKYHLEDLRTLLKLKSRKPVKIIEKQTVDDSAKEAKKQ